VQESIVYNLQPFKDRMAHLLTFYYLIPNNLPAPGVLFAAMRGTYADAPMPTRAPRHWRLISATSPIYANLRNWAKSGMIRTYAPPRPHLDTFTGGPTEHWPKPGHYLRVRIEAAWEAHRFEMSALPPQPGNRQATGRKAVKRAPPSHVDYWMRPTGARPKFGVINLDDAGTEWLRSMGAVPIPAAPARTPLFLWRGADASPVLVKCNNRGELL
jgi:hypothetical protein